MELDRLLLPNDQRERSQHHDDTHDHFSTPPDLDDDAPRHPVREELPRPASFTSVPKAHGDFDALFSFSEDDLVPSNSIWLGSSGGEKFDPVSPTQGTNVYSKTSDIPSDSRITVQRTVLVQGQASQNHPPQLPPIHARSTPTIALKPRNKEELAPVTIQATEDTPRPRLSKNLTFGRRGRSTCDESRSPEKTAEEERNGQARAPARVPSSTSLSGKFFSRENNNRSPRPQDGGVKEGSPLTRSISRGRSRLSRKSTKPKMNGLPGTPPDTSNGAAVEAKRRPVSTLLKSFSNSSVPSLARTKEVTADIPPLPSTIPDDKLNLIKERSLILKRKDDLWSVFRNLESDYTKFQSKSTALKTNVVRSSLLPFLGGYAHHPSNHSLRAEDLDRRTTILNKWWTGLLDLLQGKHGSNVSGSDRPAILDGIFGIMERVEWRYPPSPFSSLVDRESAFEHSKTDSTASTGSDEFLLESVHHNVRNMFVQNLFVQMSFVVDKMSLKHAPASLVSFCGIACAYAFFFCPGVADVLVQLWDVKPNSVNKVLRVSDLPPASSLEGSAEMAALSFPPCTHSLIFRSAKQTIKQLREAPVLPLGVDQIRWHGHWLTRWSGRDSELFYAFTRNYHSLALDFLPPEPGPAHWISTPGLVVIQAQMLTNLESTIHRQSADEFAGSAGPNAIMTFEEMFNADNPAATVPSSPLNAARLMSENRFVIVLKDLPASMANPLTRFFAHSFCEVVKAAIRSTSLYDQSACFTMCDFMQEALAILIPLQANNNSHKLPLDWRFVTDVFQKMVHSQNTTTEIRLYSMIFSLWDRILAIETWQSELSLDFLLQRDHFLRTFNHWCPMVRAYFMRLICWRLARYDGDASDNDLKVLRTLAERLQENWAYYKHLDIQARDKQTIKPSTAPCNPAPGRKLLIIRTDAQAPTPLLSFNNVFASTEDTSYSKSTPLQESSTAMAAITASSILERVSATWEYGVDMSRKRGGLFRTLWGPRTPEARSRSESPKRDGIPIASSPKSNGSADPASPDRADSRSSMYEQRPSQFPSEPKGTDKKLTLQTENISHHTPADFRFSLEAVDRRPHNTPSDLDLEPPRLPLAAHLLLQSTPGFQGDREASEIPCKYAGFMRYAGRALAEWTWVVNECQNFFERRRSEGVPSNRQVETPELGVEPFRRPG